MTYRRHARVSALQFLYQHEINPAEKLDEGLRLWWVRNDKASPQIREFAERLIRGTIATATESDEKLKPVLDNWDLSRLAVLDHLVLRLALFELFHCEDIPPVVSINEAIELAKQYGATDESGKFVNGILDRIKADILRPARQASGNKAQHPRPSTESK